MDFLEQLNKMVDDHAICTIKGYWASAGLFRYGPLLQVVGGYFAKTPHKCYVFELGENCGTVFSVDLVKEITMTGKNEYTITLKS